MDIETRLLRPRRPAPTAPFALAEASPTAKASPPTSIYASDPFRPAVAICTESPPQASAAAAREAAAQEVAAREASAREAAGAQPRASGAAAREAVSPQPLQPLSAILSLLTSNNHVRRGAGMHLPASEQELDGFSLPFVIVEAGDESNAWGSVSALAQEVE
jgi:hypothetical protein